jgi:Bifunctional DNA primase/polymerase, N-terminal
MEGFTMNALREAALHYASLGWHVLPLHNAISGGGCSCGRPSCHSPGKHPRTRRGCKDASADPSQIDRWWVKWTGANIGIATGAISGIVVLDIDGAEGRATLQELIAEHGFLPRTPVVQTARGLHFYFKLPQGVSVPCSTGSGLDIRGNGGYVVAPPSIHLSGHVYEWCNNVSR